MNALADKLAAGIARLSPFGKRIDDPLSSLKAATRWVEALPIGDAFKCQQVIYDEIKRFNENPTQLTKDRLSVLMLLDEKARDLQDTLVRQYLRNPRMSRLVESQLWHAVYGLYWEVARGYHAFVLSFVRESGKTPHESQIPLITLRAIRAFGQLLKWRAIRYLPAGEKLWLRLHNLYRVAESDGFHRKPLRAYAEETPDCNCETAYLHILMLNLANSGTLYPRQLDLVDRWLCNWQAQVQLESRFDSEQHNFSIDLSADHGPRRVRQPDSGKPLRFWATGALLHTLQDVQAELRNGAVPAQLGLTENVRTAESLDLLDHLHHQWSPLASREQRRSRRETVKRMVDVTQGLGAIINQVKTIAAPAAISPYGAGINYDEASDVQMYGFITDRTRERVSQMQPPASHPPEVERWVMQDESECGYGAQVESRDKDWLRVGALVGVKPHDASEWRIGIVRRLSRLNDETSSVGIETLATPPALAMLYDTSSSGYTLNGLDNTSARLPHASLWLPGKDQPDSMVIDPVIFMPDRVFQVHGVAAHTFIALGNPIERSEGWMRVIAEPVNN